VRPKSTEPPTKNASSSVIAPATNGSQKPKPHSLSQDFNKGLTRKQGALKRFLKNSRVTVREIESAPAVEEILSYVGNRKKIITVMRFSPEDCVQKVLKVYDATPEFDRDKCGIPLEAYILVAGVNPNELIGSVIMAFRSCQAQKSGLIAMKNHPKVLEKTIWFSQFRDGAKDRQMVHQAVGFLPSLPGGRAGIGNVHLNFGAPEKPPEAVNEDGMTSPDVNEVFPMISDRLPAWQEARQKALKAKD